MSVVTAGSPHNSIARGRSPICHDRATRRSVLNFSVSLMIAAENGPIPAAYHIDNTQSWGPISASVVSRAAGESVWRNDYHRIVYFPVGQTGTIQHENAPVER